MAEEYKNPEILKSWVEPAQPGFRVTGSAGRKNTAFPVFFLSLPSLIH